MQTGQILAKPSIYSIVYGLFAGSYNGSTAAFEAVNLGSIPSPAAL